MICAKSVVKLFCYLGIIKFAFNRLTSRYWERADGGLIEDGSKYNLENSYVKYGYYTIMRLTINRLIADDFTEYHCISKNELLATRGKILLRGN